MMKNPFPKDPFWTLCNCNSKFIELFHHKLKILPFTSLQNQFSEVMDFQMQGVCATYTNIYWIGGIFT